MADVWDKWSAQLLEDENRHKTNAGGLICDLEGNIWGVSGTLNRSMRFSQMAEMCKAVFKGGPAAQGSFNFPDNGDRYMVLREADGTIIAKKGGAGLSIMKYKESGLVVGVYPEGMQPGPSNNRVCVIGARLNEQ